MNGNPMQALKGCLDKNISVTPFTNNLPIRRLNLQPGKSAVIEAAYLAVPEGEIGRASQRYTCRERKVHGARFRYQGLTTGYEAEITTDEKDFVVEYPPVFRRI